jgi:glycosyltransferase involved in cell wall biosynthesis
MPTDYSGRVKKLIIQIPCLNEADTLPATLRALPREIEGIDAVEWLVIDDGSTDATVEVARRHGVDHIVSHTVNQGLATAFSSGLDASLRLGADIIVNTDADNQYDASYIPELIKPIVAHKADMVIGDRGTDAIDHFSWTKKRLQKLGSWVVRQASGTPVPDATSGFRAFSREAALKLHIYSNFTYTLESLIQAGNKNIATAAVPVRTNDKLRESRLFRSTFHYVRRSAGTIIRIYSLYRPMRAFVLLGGLLCLVGVGIGSRFLYYFLFDNSAGKVQSLLLAVILLVVGAQTMLTGFLADLMSHSRSLVEDVLFRVRRMELELAEVRALRDGAHVEVKKREKRVDSA